MHQITWIQNIQSKNLQKCQKTKQIYHCSEIFNIIDESSKQIRNFVIPNEQFDQIDIFSSSE